MSSRTILCLLFACTLTVGVVAQQPALEMPAPDASGVYRFKPGMLNGRPVPVRTNLELTYTQF